MSQAMPDNKQIASLAEQLSGLQSLKDGEKMPHFNATDINGKHVSLADMNAKVNVIMLWASWNYESVNLLNQIHRMTTHYGENLKVITVSIDEIRLPLGRCFASLAGQLTVMILYSSHISKPI